MKAVLLLLASMSLSAAEIQFIEVEVSGDRYHIQAESLIEVPPEIVQEALLDYDNFHRLSDDFSATHYTSPAVDGTPLAYSQLDSCILIFCMVLEKVERITRPADNEILAIAIPERSDFIYSRGRWVIKRAGENTRLYYELEMVPDFWVPPVIGAWAIRAKLRSAALVMSRRIEEMWAAGIPLNELTVQQSDSLFSR